MVKCFMTNISKNKPLACSGTASGLVAALIALLISRGVSAEYGDTYASIDLTSTYIIASPQNVDDLVGHLQVELPTSAIEFMVAALHSEYNNYDYEEKTWDIVVRLYADDADYPETVRENYVVGTLYCWDSGQRRTVDWYIGTPFNTPADVHDETEGVEYLLCETDVDSPLDSWSHFSCDVNVRADLYLHKAAGMGEVEKWVEVDITSDAPAAVHKYCEWDQKNNHGDDVCNPCPGCLEHRNPTHSHDTSGCE